MSQTTLTASPALPAPVAGAAFMVAAGVAFAGVNTLEQIATTRLGIPAPTAAFLQYAVALLAVLPWAVRRGLPSLSTRRPWLQALRVLLAALGVQAWVAGLAHGVPIGQAVALVMTSPFVVTLGAALLLGERVSIERWLAVTIGFAGGLIILDPFAETFTAASLYPLAASVLWAGVSLVQKRLLVEDSPEAVAAWLLLLLAPVNLVLALPSGLVLPTADGWIAIIAVGVLTAAAQAFLALAYSRADAAYVQPFDHVKLPLNIIAGWLVFGWLPTAQLWIGAALIIGASLFLLWRESRAPEAGRATGQSPSSS
ncbi:Permease of the drug/metabolite transporter (DMT) superfamily [Kaistia soli DSM 19436]|uniref:Permease of the drug/metabolite transporter (DMT) superfamily n=1 Tax=Kaistia soli DSM 19436 TaxID=1122133 RepID=A0A1M5LCT2_9HYPH|nr:DMT family transporter [Kaistia soli]SHG62755.1 Permease of the drug/metabolite transporter (DMT) superfamily [Kaistia soli DSM 19436]